MKTPHFLLPILLLGLVPLVPACDEGPSLCPDGRYYEYEFKATSAEQPVVDVLQTFWQDNRFFYYKEFEATNACGSTLLTVFCVLTASKDFHWGGLMMEEPYLTIDGKKITVTDDKLLIGPSNSKYGWAFSDGFNKNTQTTSYLLRIGFSLPDLRDFEDSTQSVRDYIREKIQLFQYSVEYKTVY